MTTDAPAVAVVMAELQRGDGYGLALDDRIERRTGRRLGQGSLYPALRSLERYGLARSWEVDAGAERGGRPQRWYALTDAGRAVAERGETDAKGDVQPARPDKTGRGR